MEKTITVIIPVRDRYDYRIANALKSLRGQTYSTELIDVVVIDYGSVDTYRPVFEKLCTEYNVRGIWTGVSGPWNKAHALNFAIKRSMSDYILICDVDLIFAPNYIEESIKELGTNDRQAIFSKMLDTKEGDITGEIRYPDEYEDVHSKTIYRGDMFKNPVSYLFGSSILCLKRSLLFDIRGYDEMYRLWGDEDSDMVKRLGMINIPLKDISDRTSFVHQWHEKYENVNKVAGFEKQIQENRHYYFNTNTTVRNPDAWGEISSAVEI